MKSKKNQIVLVIILAVLVVLTIVGIMASFYIPSGKKGMKSLSELETMVTEDYAQDVQFEGFVATSSTSQQ